MCILWTPFGQQNFRGSHSASFTISVPTSSDATPETATLYSDAYAEWPRMAGTPYCSKVNSTFQITSINSMISQAAQNPLPKIQQTDQTANYNVTLRLAETIQQATEQCM